MAIQRIFVLFLAVHCAALFAGESVSNIGVFQNGECRICFLYPSSFRVQVLPIIEGGLTLCEIRVKDSRADGKNEIVVAVLKAPLTKALELAGWTQDEIDPKSWKLDGYGIGKGEIEHDHDRSIISSDYSVNCGSSRAPGEAVACDAFESLISRDQISVIVDTAMSGETEAAQLISSSMRILGDTELKKRFQQTCTESPAGR